MGSHEVDLDLLPRGSTPLHCAAMSDDVDSLTEILYQGQTSIDALDRWGRTPLHAALENGRFKTAMYLIRNQANLNLKNPEGNSTYDILHSKAFIEFLEEIVDQNVHIDIKPQELLPVAINDDNVKLLAKVLAYPAVNVNHQDEMGRTVLHDAVQRQNMSCVKLLLGHRAHVDLKDWRDSTALHCAAIIGNLELFQILLDDFPDINVALNGRDHAGRNVLHLALMYKHHDIVSYLLTEHSNYVQYKLADSTGVSVEELLYQARDHLGPRVIPCVSSEEAQILLHEAVYQGDTANLSLLVEQGANLNYFDLMQQTPLLAATRLGHLGCVEELLNLGALLSISDFSGNTPLHYAACLGHTQIALAMLKTPGIKLSSFNNNLETPLHLALLNHHANTAVALLDNLDNRHDENWLACLDSCASWADKELLGHIKTQLLPHNWQSVLLDEESYNFSCNPTPSAARVTLVFDISKRERYWYVRLSRCRVVCPQCGKDIRLKSAVVRKHKDLCWDTKSALCEEWFSQYSSIDRTNPRNFSSGILKLNKFTRNELAKHSLQPEITKTKSMENSARFINAKSDSSEFYPIHTAASANNVDFLDMIFSAVYNMSEKRKLLMSVNSTGRKLSSLLSTSCASVPNLLVQYNILDIVSQEQEVETLQMPIQQLSQHIKENTLTLDHWELFTDALDDVPSLPLCNTHQHNHEPLLVTCLQKFQQSHQSSSGTDYLNAEIVYKICNKGLHSALLELIVFWRSCYHGYGAEIEAAAKSVIYHSLNCRHMPAKAFAAIVDELISIVGSEHSSLLISHYRYFFTNSRQNMAALVVLVLKLFNLDVLSWKFLSKIQSSLRRILLPFAPLEVNEDSEDPILQITSSKRLCHELIAAIKHCQGTSNMLLGACAVGSIELIKLLLSITPASCYVELSKSYHFFVTSVAIELHDTALLSAILDANDGETLLSCTLVYCCRWRGIPLGDDSGDQQINREFHKQSSSAVFKKTIKFNSKFSECSPHVYSYRPLDELKEAEQSRRDMVNLLLNRDDVLAYINTSYGGYAPALLIAIQHHWSWGALQLLSSGADPATHWNKKYVLMESMKRGQFTVVEQMMNMMSEDSIGALRECEDFLPLLVKHLDTLAFSNQSDLLTNIIQQFHLSDYLWNDLTGGRLISLCLNHHLFEAAVYLILNAISYISVVCMNNDDECSFPLLKLARHVECSGWGVEEEKVWEIIDTLCQFCTLLSRSYFKLTDAFCRACGEGLCEYVDTLLTLVDDTVKNMLLTSCDGYHRSPLFHAAYGGHIELVRILFNHGATINMTLDCNHPVMGVLGGLIVQLNAPCTSLVNGLYTDGKLGGKLKNYAASQIRKCLPDCTPSCAHLEERTLAELVELILSNSSSEISFILSSGKEERHVYYDDEESDNDYLLAVPAVLLVSLIANYPQVINAIKSIANSNTGEHACSADKLVYYLSSMLCDFMAKCLEVESPEMEVHNENMLLLDVVMYISPWYNEKLCIYEEFITNNSNSITPDQALAAATKGYWLLVEKAARRFNIRSCDAEQLQNWERILCHAIISKKIQLSQTILSAGMKSAGINSMAPTALHLAVKFGYSQLVNAMIYKHGYQILFPSKSLCGFRFHCSALDMAAVHGHVEMLSNFLDGNNYQCLSEEPVLLYKLVYLSSLFDQQDCLKVLQRIHSTLQLPLTADMLDHLHLTFDELWPNIIEADANTQFWLIVLLGSLTHGHQGMCREALSRLFYREDYDTFMHYLVNSCCYWGMDVILQDLSLTSKYNFVSLGDESVSPFEHSLVGGQFGKLSRFFISSLEQYDKLENVEMTHHVFHSMTVGWFGNLCRLHNLKQLPPIEIPVPYLKLSLFNCKSSLAVFCRAIDFNIPTIVQAFLVTLDAAVGTIIKILLKSFYLLHRSAVHPNTDCLSLLLNTLSGQNLLDGINTCDSKGHTPLSVAISKGSIACSQLLVRNGANLKFRRHPTKENLVHMAVVSGKLDMLKFLIDLSYFQRHKQELNVENSCGMTPLVIALSHGYHEIASLLVKELKMDPLCVKIGKEYFKARNKNKPEDQYSLGWLLSLSLGWFSVLMKKNESLENIDCDTISSLLYNLRLSDDKIGKVATFRSAIKANQTSIVHALMATSHNTLLLNQQVAEVCSKLQLQLLSTHADVHLNSVKTPLITWLLSHGLDKDCASFIEQFHPTIAPSNVDYQNVFLSCCSYGASETARVIMDKHLCSPDLVAANGINHCLGGGSFSLAAEILLKTHHPSTIPNYIGTDYILLQALFDPSVVIHKAFIDNVKQLDSIGLPEAILTHRWSESDRTFFMEKIHQQGTCDAIRNCRLSLTLAGMRSTDVDIDWTSFDTVLQGANRCPLEIESIVFSSLILSDVLSKLRQSKVTNLHSLSVSCSSQDKPSVEACPGMSWLKVFVTYNQEANIILYPDVDIVRLLMLEDTSNDTSSAPTSIISYEPVIGGVNNNNNNIEEDGLAPFVFTLDPPVDVECAELHGELLDELNALANSIITQHFPNIESVSLAVDSTTLEMAKDNPNFTTIVNDLLVELANATTLVAACEFRYNERFCITCGCPYLHGKHIESCGFPQTIRNIEVGFSVLDETSDFKCDISLHDNKVAKVVFYIPKDLEISSVTASNITVLAVAEFKRAQITLNIQSELLVPLARQLNALLGSKIPVSLKYLVQKDTEGNNFEDIFDSPNDCPDCLIQLRYVDLLWRNQCVMTEVLCLLQHLCVKPELKFTLLGFIRNGLNIFIQDSTEASVMQQDGGSMALRISISDVVKQHLTLANLIPHHLLDLQLVKHVAFPIASYIDPNSISNILYAVCNSSVIFKLFLADIMGSDVTNHVPEFSVNVTIRQPNSKLVMATSKESLPTQPLTVICCKNGMYEITWKPSQPGVHQIGITVNGFPTRESPFTTCVSITPKKEYSLYSTTERLPKYSLGSGGCRTTTAGKPLVFIVSHPDVPCRQGICKPDVDTTKFLSTYTKSNKFDPSFVQRLSERPGLKGKSRDNYSPVHYFTVCSKNGGFREWTYNPFSSLIEFHNKTGERLMKSDCVALGKQKYRVSLRLTTSAEFKLFMACANCQAVMNISWLDSTSMDYNPVRCFVVPAPLHPPSCTVHRSKEILKRERTPFSARAGTQKFYYIAARDKFYNHVNTDKTAAGTVSFKIPHCGTKFPLNTPPEGPTISQILTTVNKDCQCETQYLGNGIYEVKFTPYSSQIGYFHLCYTDAEGKNISSRIYTKSLMMKPGPPSALHSRVLYYSDRIALGENFDLKIYICDQYFNVLRMSLATFKQTVCYNVSSVRSSQVFIRKNDNFFVLSFRPKSSDQATIRVSINGVHISQTPVVVMVSRGRIQPTEPIEKIAKLYHDLRQCRASGLSTQMVERKHILNSALRIFGGHNLNYMLHVSFDDEIGLDMGGPAKEFFHLVSLELVNPDYALYECVNGLYKPNRNSHVNPAHLDYFKLTGTIMAKAICDGRNISTKFTPSVYKYLLSLECGLEDLRLEDSTVYSGLTHILRCTDPVELEELSFAVANSHFGALQTIELEAGGMAKTVTMENRSDYVFQMCHWYLTGCIQTQLQSIKSGFCQLIKPSMLKHFNEKELQLAITGKENNIVIYLKRKLVYQRSVTPKTKQWVPEILESFTQEEVAQFLIFCTGSPNIPLTDSWNLVISSVKDRGLGNLPTAITCSNTLRVPEYSQKSILEMKLRQAISLGQDTFLMP